jgi:hypothetical protein
MRWLVSIPRERRLPLALAAILVVVLAIVGFSIGRSSRDDPGGATDARAKAHRAAFKTSRAAARKAARRAGYKAGYEQGARAGHLAGKRAARRRVKRELARGATGSPGVPGSGTPSPYTDQGGNPAPNPGCPTGQEPTPGGGCAPYNENNGQIEPKIDDPDCKPNPPDGCF